MKIRLNGFFLALLFFQLPAASVPAFTFYRANGISYTRENMPKGRCSVFLFVDPTCDHCQNAIANFQQQYASFSTSNILIVSLSDHNTMNNFLKRFAPALAAKKNIIVLQDRQDSFITLFGPRKYPGMFLYGTNNQLLDYEDDPQTIFRLVREVKAIKNKP